MYLQDNHFLIVLYVYVSTYLILLLMVVSLVHVILTLKINKEMKDVPKYRILLYALPSIVIFSFYLSAFFLVLCQSILSFNGLKFIRINIMIGILLYIHGF